MAGVEAPPSPRSRKGYSFAGTTCERRCSPGGTDFRPIVRRYREQAVRPDVGATQSYERSVLTSCGSAAPTIGRGTIGDAKHIRPKSCHPSNFNIRHRRQFSWQTRCDGVTATRRR